MVNPSILKRLTRLLSIPPANGGGGLLTAGAKIPKDEIAGRIINSTPKDLRYYLMKWIENEKVVSPKALNNWSVIRPTGGKKGRRKTRNCCLKKKQKISTMQIELSKIVSDPLKVNVLR